jgi:hypothetical protein
MFSFQASKIGQKGLILIRSNFNIMIFLKENDSYFTFLNKKLSTFLEINCGKSKIFLTDF